MNRRKIFSLLFFGGLTVALAVGGFLLAVQLFLGSSATVVVPNVEGRELILAVEALSQRELSVQVDKFNYSDQFDRGYVIAQYPPEGRRVKAGRVIQLTISLGINEVSVPNVVGVQSDFAIQVLQGYALKARVAGEVCAGGRPGEAIAQRPMAATPVKRGENIGLIISRGSCGNIYLAPSLVGQYFSNWQGPLEEAGLNPIRFQQEVRGRPDEIVGQEPAPDRILIGGESLYLKTVVLPYMVGGDEIVLRYLAVRAPVGLLEQTLSVETYTVDFNEVRIDTKIPPGRVKHIIVPGLAGTVPQVRINGETVKPFKILEAIF